MIIIKIIIIIIIIITFIIIILIIIIIIIMINLHGEEVAGADKEEVSNHVGYHLLVEEPVLHLLPVRVLKKYSEVTQSLY